VQYVLWHSGIGFIGSHPHQYWFAKLKSHLLIGGNRAENDLLMALLIKKSGAHRCFGIYHTMTSIKGQMALVIRPLNIFHSVTAAFELLHRRLKRHQRFHR
jgi:hypothetical protein